MKWLRAIYSVPPPPRPGEINHGALDWFTLVHWAIGFGYGALGLEFWIAFVLAVGWEIIENPLKVHFRFLFFHPSRDTILNVIGDVLAVMAGWGAAILVWHRGG
jgi:hypothetical protein